MLTVLFYLRATHSFVSTRVIDGLCRPSIKLDKGVHIILPRGDRVIAKRGIQALPVTVEGRELCMDVMEIEIDDFDLIFGMDTLAKYGANIDYKKQIVTFSPEGEQPFVFVGSMFMSRIPRISTLKAKELLN